MEEEICEHDERFLSFDRSVLTALLASVSSTPQKAAHDVLERFSSFPHAARADHHALSAIIGDQAATLLKTIPNAVVSMTRETAMRAASYMLSIEAAQVHFSALLNGRRNEVFAVIYLNLKNRLIDDDVWEGTIDRTSIYPREILRRAILLDASAIVMAHNHPSGDPTPSREDLNVTSQLEKALESVDVILLDHMIFGEGEAYSLRENGDI